MNFIFKYLLWNPVFYLFKNGPCTRVFPFWCGKTNEVICAELSKTAVEIWQKNSQECDSIIIREVSSYTTLILISLYVVVIVKLGKLSLIILGNQVFYSSDKKKSNYTLLC